MSDQQFEDEIDKYKNLPSPQTIEHLLKQNKIKNTALDKATNLIQLLQIELQVQKNGYKQALNAKEDECKIKYSLEINRLKEKVIFLQEEVKKRSSDLQNSHSHNNSLARSGSVRSLVRKDKKLSNTRIKNVAHKKIQYPSVKNDIIKKILLCGQEECQIIVTELMQVIRQEKQQINNLQQSISILKGQQEQLGQKDTKDKDNQLIKDFISIIKNQQILINRMKTYQKELEQLIEGLKFRLDNIISQLQLIQWPTLIKFDLPLLLSQLNNKKNPISSLKRQNQQIRNILQNMIALVRQDIIK